MTVPSDRAGIADASGPGRAPGDGDPVQALSAAAEVFSRHGYAGASRAALAEAMGVSEPSVDSCFGGRSALFLRVLETRAEALNAAYEAAFERGRSLRAALVSFFDRAVELNLKASAVPGCVIASAATTEACRDAAVADFARGYFALSDQLVAKWIRDKRGARGMLGSEAAAVLANGVVRDIALRARVGESEEKLRELAHHAAITLARMAEEGAVRGGRRTR